jgi:hypothetical protein
MLFENRECDPSVDNPYSQDVADVMTKLPGGAVYTQHPGLRNVLQNTTALAVTA